MAAERARLHRCAVAGGAGAQNPAQSKAATLAQGLEQTALYADQCGADSAHLLIFNRDAVVDWEEKIYCESHSHAGRSIEVWGM